MVRRSQSRDLTGQCFGRLKARWPVGRSGKHGQHVHWLCSCSCGKSRVFILSNLTKPGHSQSCGCLRIEQLRARSIVHGHTLEGKISREYITWAAMKARCYDSRNKRFEYYGGRGIKVCERWLGQQGFQNFFADMGSKPYSLTLDRKDNDGDYTPDNCRWATYSQQNSNRRKFRIRRIT